MSRYRKKNGIPDRWLDYKAVGKRLRGTRFIAFKVPLKQSLNRQVSAPHIFGPWELLDALEEDNQELGLIIDLTFTTRYYRLQDLPESLLAVKIFTQGHEVPSDATILCFKRVVRRFLRDNADNDKLIGVHCTHGLNRTGYLICRYLIDVDGMDPTEAIELFNAARGHAIERQNYLTDLQTGPRRSNEGMEDPEQEPQRGCADLRPGYPSPPPDRRPAYPAPPPDRRPAYPAPPPDRRPGYPAPPPDRRPAYPAPPPDRRPGYPAPPPDRRPGYPASPTSRDERQLRGSKSRCHWSLPPRDALLPRPPLLPTPPPLCPPAVGPSFHPYRWTPPHPDGQQSRPLMPAETRSRFSRPEPDWGPASRLQQDRRGLLPPPVPCWTNQNHSYDGPGEEWAGPSHHYRVNGYDRY